jgi:Cytidylate kinase-like family
MTVWTISAEEGTGGDQVASGLAAAADVTLLDRPALAHLASQLDPNLGDLGAIDELEKRVGSWLVLLALGLPSTPAAADAVRELQLYRALPELGRTVTAEAARRPCVIFAPAAFAAMPQHPAAVHVRLWAPLEWRVATHAREQVVSRRCAEKTVRHDDHLKRAWVKSLYHVDIRDTHHFAVVLDVSRLSTERLLGIVLAAGGSTTADATARTGTRARRTARTSP